MADTFQPTIEDAARVIANAITSHVMGGTDAAGGHVECLTEAVMGMTAAIVQVAQGLQEIAAAIRETTQGDQP